MIEIADLRDCPSSGRLYGGRAGRKEGILINGEPWIAKYPRSTRDLKGHGLPSYTSSPLSEYLGSHIYALLGIPMHETRLGYRDGKIVCACRDFTHPNLVLYEFSKVKTTMDDDAFEGFHGSPSDGEAIYLSDVLATIETSSLLKSVAGVRERFWDMFVVDALIKNPDRNNGNWGVLWDGSSYVLAPVYDNGSSLFSKRRDSVMERRSYDEKNVEKDAFGTNVSAYLVPGDDGRPHHIHPFDYMRETGNPDLAAAIRRVVERMDLDAVEGLFMEVPGEAYGWRLMTEGARDAQLALIRRRFEEGLAPLA